MKIYKAELTEHLIEELILLSARWEQENSCFGYRKNTPEDIQKEDVFVAVEDNRLAGYLFCHTYEQDRESPTVPKESKCLEIEELYVIPEFRSKGIGRKLYQFAVSCYEGAVKFVTLSTATKNYKAILHFYIEELGMNFWSARLFCEL